MQPAKYQLAVVVAIALITGLLYSQVCALNCTVYGCRQPSSAAEKSDQPGHCHEQQAESSPAGHDNTPDKSPGCPSHSELSALISSTKTTVGAFNLSLHAPAGVPVSVCTAAIAAGGLMSKPDQAPFRAPPTHSILRI